MRLRGWRSDWKWLACVRAADALIPPSLPESQAETALATARRRVKERRKEAAAAPGVGVLVQQVRRAEEDVRYAEREVVLRQAAAAAAARGLPRPEPPQPRS